MSDGNEGRAREIAEALYSKAIHDDDGSEETIAGCTDMILDLLSAAREGRARVAEAIESDEDWATAREFVGLLADYMSEDAVSIVTARLAQFRAEACAAARESALREAATLVERHAHGMTSGVFMRMAERIRALLPAPPPPPTKGTSDVEA